MKNILFVARGLIPRCLQRLKKKQRKRVMVLTPRPIPRENEIPSGLPRGILFSLLFFTSVLAYGQELSINSVINNRPFYNNGKLKVIIYYIPFSILTRSSLGIEDVKNMYHLKIESTNYNGNIFNFIQAIKNNVLQILDNNYRGNIRAVVEFYYDNEIIFSYALDQFHIVINGNGIQYNRQFYEFLTLYLPKEYEYDNINILK